MSDDEQLRSVFRQYRDGLDTTSLPTAEELSRRSRRWPHLGVTIGALVLLMAVPLAVIFSRIAPDSQPGIASATDGGKDAASSATPQPQPSVSASEQVVPITAGVFPSARQLSRIAGRPWAQLANEDEWFAPELFNPCRAEENPTGLPPNVRTSTYSGAAEGSEAASEEPFVFVTISGFAEHADSQNVLENLKKDFHRCSKDADDGTMASEVSAESANALDVTLLREEPGGELLRRSFLRFRVVGPAFAVTHYSEPGSVDADSDLIDELTVWQVQRLRRLQLTTG